MSNASSAQVDNLVNLLDGYATKGGHHLNVNVLNRDTLLDEASRKLSPAHHPCQRICRKLYQTDTGTAG